MFSKGPEEALAAEKVVRAEKCLEKQEGLLLG